MEINQDNLNTKRKEGFRPGVIVCLIFEKKLLLLFKEEYKLWGLPQGKIQNKEDAIFAISRVVLEEIGDYYAPFVDLSSNQVILTDQIEFKPGRHEVEAFNDDEGNKIEMKGKFYYVCVLNCSSAEIKIEKSQFDQFFWVTHSEGMFLANTIHQQGKKRVTVKILDELKRLGMIS